MESKRVILRNDAKPKYGPEQLNENILAHFIAISEGGDWVVLKDRATGYNGIMSDLYLAAYLWRYYYGPSKVDKERG